MDKFDLLKLLLAEVENFYINESNTKDLNSFLTWLSLKQHPLENSDNLLNTSKFNNADEQINSKIINVENGIGILNGLMYRYSRMYSKVALEHSTNLSLEEFSFLATLSSFEGCTKTELINSMIFEKSTGIEIIKRLINSEFASEEINMNDKRSKILKITSLGKNILYSAFNQMETVSKEITSILDITEKKALHYILTKLEKHHRTNIDSNIERLKKLFGNS